MNSKSKWETTSSEYGLLQGEYINLIATMCVTDSNSQSFSFKPIPLPEDVEDVLQEVEEDAEEDIDDNEEVAMADKGTSFKILHILTTCSVDCF